MDFIEVEICGWDKYNPRRDYKKPWWFALSNTITSDQMFSEFSDAEFRAWIHILCTASVQNAAVAKVFFKHADRACGIKRQSLMSAIRKLEILKVIRIPAGICTDSVQDPFGTEQNKQNRTIQNNNAQPDGFAEFWSGYPRKVGKGKALKAYASAIKSGASPKDLLVARDKYRHHCECSQTEAKYIKHGSTFMSEWRDWLDESAGQAQDFSQTGEAAKRQAETDAEIHELFKKSGGAQ